MQDAKCQSRGLVRGCNGAKVKGEKWNGFGKCGANSQRTREQKKQFHKNCQNNNFTPHLKVGQQNPQKPQGRK